ncbi:hypothetical protein JCM10449v2_005422 [Rhodotorula kratochvilovae]
MSSNERARKPRSRIGPQGQDALASPFIFSHAHGVHRFLATRPKVVEAFHAIQSAPSEQREDLCRALLTSAQARLEGEEGAALRREGAEVLEAFMSALKVNDDDGSEDDSDEDDDEPSTARDPQVDALQRFLHGPAATPHEGPSSAGAGGAPPSQPSLPSPTSPQPAHAFPPPPPQPPWTRGDYPSHPAVSLPSSRFPSSDFYGYQIPAPPPPPFASSLAQNPNAYFPPMPSSNPYLDSQIGFGARYVPQYPFQQPPPSPFGPAHSPQQHTMPPYVSTQYAPPQPFFSSPQAPPSFSAPPAPVPYAGSYQPYATPSSYPIPPAMTSGNYRSPSGFAPIESPVESPAATAAPPPATEKSLTELLASVAPLFSPPASLPAATSASAAPAPLKRRAEPEPSIPPPPLPPEDRTTAAAPLLLGSTRSPIVAAPPVRAAESSGTSERRTAFGMLKKEWEEVCKEMKRIRGLVQKQFKPVQGGSAPAVDRRFTDRIGQLDARRMELMAKMEEIGNPNAPEDKRQKREAKKARKAARDAGAQ